MADKNHQLGGNGEHGANDEVEELTADYRSGRLGRRAFLGRLGSLGVASTVAYQLLRSAPAAAQPQNPTTLMVGEEGTTTDAEGEEELATTQAVGEEDPTTLAVGEEDGPTTEALGEEEPATTQAVGEEDPTTLMVGEEDDGSGDPGGSGGGGQAPGQPQLAFTGSEATLGLAGTGLIAAGAAALGMRRRLADRDGRRDVADVVPSNTDVEAGRPTNHEDEAPPTTPSPEDDA